MDFKEIEYDDMNWICLAQVPSGRLSWML